MIGASALVLRLCVTVCVCVCVYLWLNVDRSTSVDEWADFTERNLTEAEKQRRSSTRLRAISDGVLQTSCNDINRQRSSVDLAIEMRVSELRDAKEKLEQHLNKVTLHATSLTRRLADRNYYFSTFYLD